MKTPNNILVIRLSALGDVAMTIPIIYSVAINNPECRITVLTKPFFARLFVNCPKNISFILFEQKHRSIGGLISLIHKLHKRRFDAVADLHNILRGWIIDMSFLLTFTKVVMVQKMRKERQRLLKGNESERRMFTRPYTYRYVDVFNKLSLNVEPIITQLPESGLNPLPEPLFTKDEGNKWIGIAPFARYANKTYPSELMQKVIGILARRPNSKIFLFGSKEDCQTMLPWTQIADNITCVAGQMDIEKELALMKQLDVMISMDSANHHLAALVGTSVISIWGSTTPHCGFTGWRQPASNALWADIPCQPCTIAGSKHCAKGGMECLLSITPEKIANAVNKILDN